MMESYICYVRQLTMTLASQSLKYLNMSQQLITALEI